jgi:transposase
MSTKRKNYSSELKAKIVLEAIKGFSSINDIAKEYRVHPNQISIWKKQLLELSPQFLIIPEDRKPMGTQSW